MLHNEITRARHQKVLLKFAEKLSLYDSLKGNVDFDFLITDLSNELAVFINEVLSDLFRFGFTVERQSFDSILTHACHLVAEIPIKPPNNLKAVVANCDVLIKEIEISHGICWSRGGNIPGFNITAQAEIWHQDGQVHEVPLVTEFLVDPCPCCGQRYLSCSVKKDTALGEGCGRTPRFYDIP